MTDSVVEILNRIGRIEAELEQTSQEIDTGEYSYDQRLQMEAERGALKWALDVMKGKR